MWTPRATALAFATSHAAFVWSRNNSALARKLVSMNRPSGVRGLMRSWQEANTCPLSVISPARLPMRETRT